MSTAGDMIDSLSTDNTQLTYKEKNMIDALYPSTDVAVIEKTIEKFPAQSKKVWISFKEIIISTILFVIFNLPPVDALIGKLSKSENPTYRLAMKSILFAVTFFVLTNFSLARA
jgi:hypothetical protein